ncbi:MAG: hypothetical protein ABSC23_03735 [Bryobacteraceae bacterium]|jgi:hypothetical protein
MLNPKLITDAVTAVLQNIPELATAMTVTDAGGNATVRIAAFHYRLGSDSRLMEVVFKMPAPSILVTWEGTEGGNFDASTIFKHRIAVYFRMGNMAGSNDPVGYEDLWWTVCNRPPNGKGVNIRYLNILPELDIMDTPSVAHLLDEDRMDIFRGEFVIPEVGDN